MVKYIIRLDTEEKGKIDTIVEADNEQTAIYKATEINKGMTFHKIMVWDIQ
jgi:hypothetical protein